MTDEDTTSNETRGLDLSPAIQQHILGMVLQDAGVMARVRSVLDPSHFDDEAISDVVAWVNHQWDTYKQVPSRAALLDQFALDGQKQHRRVIKRSYIESLSDPKHTISRIVEFARNKAIRAAVYQCAQYYQAQANGQKLLDERGKEIVIDPQKVLRDAQAVGTDMNDLGDLLDAKLIDAMEKEILNPTEVETFATGRQHLDECGMRIGRGEVGCVLGVAKGGKSFDLLNIAVGNAKECKRVFYYNFEIPRDRMLYRQFRRVAGKKGDMKVDPAGFIKLLRTRMPKLIKTPMLIKRMYAGVHTLNDVRAHMTHAISAGIRPDLVIVDYLGIVKPARPNEDRRFQLEANWLDFRAMCQEFEVAGWSAAQTNRSGADVELVTMTQIGEAFAIAQHIDAGYSISMTQEERNNNQGRYFIFASRNEKDGLVIPYEYDFSVGIIQTKSIEQPVVQEKPQGNGGKGQRRRSSDEEREDAAFADAAADRRKKAPRDDHRP